AALERLAAADALRSLDQAPGDQAPGDQAPGDQAPGGLDRRRALWALKALGEAPLPLFANNRHSGDGRDPLGNSRVASGMGPDLRRGDKKESETRAAALLPAMPLGEHVVEDYATVGMTLKRHP